MSNIPEGVPPETTRSTCNRFQSSIELSRGVEGSGSVEDVTEEESPFY